MSTDTHATAKRTSAELRHHYEVEKELAARLKNASREERRYLYSSVYNELYERVPDHPQLTRKASPAHRSVAIRLQLRFLARFMRHQRVTFLEVGPGDCALSVEVAKTARCVYAVDVSSGITSRRVFPDNLQLALSDGTSIPVPANSVDVAYSNQLMEHLHPDDAREQLQNIYAALAPGGVYVCVTPSRLSGPHDISYGFDDVATGFHLKEYTIAELDKLFKQTGFKSTRCYVGIQNRYLRLPTPVATTFEALFGMIPRRFAKRAARWRLCDAILGIRLVGMKS